MDLIRGQLILTFTTVTSTPARCKIGAAFFSKRVFAFLEEKKIIIQMLMMLNREIMVYLVI